MKNVIHAVTKMMNTELDVSIIHCPTCLFSNGAFGNTEGIRRHNRTAGVHLAGQVGGIAAVKEFRQRLDELVAALDLVTDWNA